MTWSVVCYLLCSRHPPRLANSLAVGRAHHQRIVDPDARKNRCLVRQIPFSGSPQGLWWDFRFYSRVSQRAGTNKSEPVRLVDLLAFHGDIKQDWDGRTTIMFVGSFERQLCPFPLWLIRHDDRVSNSTHGAELDCHFSQWSINPRDLPGDSLPQRSPDHGTCILPLIHEGASRQMAKGAHTGSVSEHTSLKRRKSEDDDSSGPQAKKPRTRVRYVSIFSY